jgi:hypothetical protein
MPQLYINDQVDTAAIPAQTWGELLAALEARADRDGVLLTAARFDGVDEPSFRDADVIARPLGSVREVRVETAAPSAFLRQCLLDTIPSLHEGSAQARETGILFRGEDLTSAQQGLAKVGDDLRALAGLMATLSGPLGIDLGSVRAGGVDGTAAVHELETLLGELVAAQQSDDWLTVADLLEYDFEPTMIRFAALLQVLAERL